MIRGATFLRWAGLVFLILSLFEPFSAIPAGAEAEPPPPPGDIELSLDGTPAPFPTEPVFVPTEVPEPTHAVAPEPTVEPTEAPLPNIEETIEPTNELKSPVEPLPVPTMESGTTPVNDAELSAGKQSSSTAAAQGLSVNVRADSTDVYWNDTIGLTITLTNTGDADITELVLRGPSIPTTWTFGDSPAAAACLIEGAGLLCDFTAHGGDLLPLHGGESIVLYVSGITPYCHGRHFDVEADWDGGTVRAMGSVLVDCSRFTITTDPVNAEVAAGDEISFTVRAEREYSGVVNFRLALPDAPGMTWTYSKIGDCAFGSQAPFTLGCYPNVASHLPFEVTVTSPTTDWSCGTYQVVADAYYPYDKVSNTATVTVICPPNVEITKTSEPELVAAGESIGFTIALINTGNSAVTDASFTDQLPTVGGQEWAFTGEAPEECEINASGLLTCEGIELPAQSGERSIRVGSDTATDGTTCGEFTSTATLGAPYIGSDDATAMVTCEAKLVTSDMTLESNEVHFGDAIRFIQKTTNIGSAASDDTAITANLPHAASGTLSWTASAVSTDNGACTPATTADGTSIDCTGINLGIGESFDIHFTSTPTATQCGEFDLGDWGTVSVICPQIAISVEVVDAEVRAGDDINFMVVIRKTAPFTGFTTSWLMELPGAEGMTWQHTGGSQCSFFQETPNLLECRQIQPSAGVYTVMVTSPTTEASCGTYSVFTTNRNISPYVDSNPATVTVRCPEPESNVSITKVAVAEVIDVGEPISYTMTVANTGHAASTPYGLEDQLPAVGNDPAWEITSSDFGGLCAIAIETDGHYLDCFVDELAPEETRSITIQHPTSDETCGVFPNTAVLYDADAEVHDSASATVTVICPDSEPDVTITKVADAAEINYGGRPGFTITVTNNGADPATGIAFKDALPSDGTVWWVMSRDVAECDLRTNGVLTCSGIDLAPDEPFSVHVRHISEALSHCGMVLESTATLTAGGEGAASARISMICPSPSITFELDAEEVMVGDTISVTITYSELFAGASYSYYVNLPREPESPGVTWSGSTCGEFGSNCGFIPAGTSFVRTYTSLPVTMESCGIHEVSAGLRNDLAMRESTTFSVICPDPKVEISTVADAETINYGDRPGFTITVTNTGDAPATGVAFEDTFPGPFWTMSTSLEQCSFPGDLLSCTGIDLEPGDKFTVHIHHVYSSWTRACGPGWELESTATLTAGGTGSATARIDIICPELAVTIVPDADQVIAGEDISFTVTVTNASAFDAEQTMFRALLPKAPGLLWSRSSVGQDPDLLGECDVSKSSVGPDELNCTIYEFGPERSFVVQVSSPTTVESCGVQNAYALLRHPGQPVQTDPVSVTVICPAPEISITSSVAPASGYIGDTVLYTYSVMNTGDVPLTEVTVTDPLFDAAIPECAVDTLPVNDGSGQHAYTCLVQYTINANDVVNGSIVSTATVDAVFGEVPVSHTTAPLSIQVISVAIPEMPVLTQAACVDGSVTSPEIIPNNTVGITYTVTPASGWIAGDTVTVTAQLEAGYGWPQETPAGWSPIPDVPNQLATTIELETPDCPSLTLEMTASPQNGNAVREGDLITYTLTVKNPGNLPLTDVMVESDLTNLVWEDAFPGGSVGDLALTTTTVVTATYTVTASDVARGEVNHEALAQGTSTAEGGAMLRTNPRTTAHPVTQFPAIELEMSATLQPATDSAPLGLIAYTFTVTNSGDSTLTGITISDPLLDDGPISVGDLAPGAEATVSGAHTIVQTEVDAGVANNEATVKGTPPTGPTVSDSTSTSTIIPQHPGLALTKQVTGVTALGGTERDMDPDEPVIDLQAGDTIAYTLVATNTGNVTLTDVTITDPMLQDLACDQATTLGPTESLSCTGTYTLMQRDINAGDPIVNEGATSGTPPQGAPVTATDSVTVYPELQRPALALTMTTAVNGAPSAPITGLETGDAVVFTLVAANAGNTTLEDVGIDAPLLGSLDCALPAWLEPSQTVRCTGTYTVTQNDVDSGTPIAVIATATSEAVDTVMATETLGMAAASPIIQLDKTASDATGVDDEITWELTATNTGNVTLTGVIIIDELPGLSALDCNQPTVLAPTDTLTCTATSSVSQAHVDDGKAVNTATVSATAPNDTVVTDTASVTVSLVQERHLSIVKTATLPNDAADAREGDTITYAFEVTNTGTVTLSGVMIDDPLTGIAWEHAHPDGAVGVLAPNVPHTIIATYQVTLQDVYEGEIVNTATVSGHHDNTSVTASADATVLVTNAPLLSLAKTASTPDGQPVTAGTVVTYSFEVVNTGDVTLTGIQVIDHLPGIIWDAGNPGGTLGDLWPGESRTIMATYEITPADVEMGTVPNSAVATGNAPSGEIASNVSTANLTVEQNPQIAIARGCPDIPEGTRIGDTIAYEVTISNTGDITLTAIAVEHNREGAFNEAFPETLAPGASATRAFSSTITTGDVLDGNVDTIFTVLTGQGVDATADTACAFSPVLDFSVEHTGNGPIRAGDHAIFTTVITNTGDAAMNDITFTGTLPIGLNWTLDPGVSSAAVSFFQAAHNITVENCTVADGIIECTIDGLAAGASARIIATAQTAPHTCESLEGRARITTSQGTSEHTAEITLECGRVEIASVVCATDIARDVALVVTDAGNVAASDDEDCSPLGDVGFSINGGHLTTPFTGMTDKNGVASVDLAPGTYVFTESETGAAVAFEVSLDGTTSITVLRFEMSQAPEPPASPGPEASVTTLPGTGSGGIAAVGSPGNVLMLFALVTLCLGAAYAVRRRPE